MIKILGGVFIMLSVFNFYTANAMTLSQLKKSTKIMRNACQPKNKVPNEKIENINKGEFIDDPNVKCYIACVFTMAQSVKNGKLNYEAALKQIDIYMPDNLKEPAKKAMGICRSVADKDKDICEASFKVAKCLYETNPEVFLFP